MTVIAWPAEKVAALYSLIDAKVPYSRIGCLMGITKNAAVGKAHRGGRCVPKEARTMEARLSKAIKFPGPGRCCFPIGDPGSGDFQFCGDRVEAEGQPYCSTHWDLTHTAVVGSAYR